MDSKTVEMIKGWLEIHKGDVEGLAQWMAYTVRIGSITECRKIINEVVNG